MKTLGRALASLAHSPDEGTESSGNNLASLAHSPDGRTEGSGNNLASLAHNTDEGTESSGIVSLVWPIIPMKVPRALVIVPVAPT